MQERFGPGWSLYLFTLLALFLCGYGVTRGFEDVQLLFWGVFSFVAAWPGWVWYEVDGVGIRRAGLLGARTWEWSEIGRVKGRQIEGGRTGYRLVQWVVDPRGRRLFHLSPFLARRRELARRIRKEAMAARPEDHTDVRTGRAPGSTALDRSRRTP